MLSTRGRWALTVLFLAPALLLLPAGPARAQGGCGQGMNRSRGSTMMGQSPLMPQQTAQYQQYAMQQYAMQQYGQQQQNAALAAWLQQQQQNAALAALVQQQQNAAPVQLLAR